MRCSDYYKSHAEVVSEQRRGRGVSGQDVCVICKRHIIMKNATVPLNAVLIFNCGHLYHESCLMSHNGKQQEQQQLHCYLCAITDEDSEVMDGG